MHLVAFLVNSLLKFDDLSGEPLPAEASDKASLLAIAWDRKVLVAKLVKSDLKVYKEWALDSAATGVAWLDDRVRVCTFHCNLLQVENML